MNKESKSDEGNSQGGRMEWYFNELAKQDNNRGESNGKKAKRKANAAPRMEYFFDEITEKVTVRCPITMRIADVEGTRSASRQDSPFVDIVYCSIFGCAPSCDKKCLTRINNMKHFI